MFWRSSNNSFEAYNLGSLTILHKKQPSQRLGQETIPASGEAQEKAFLPNDTHAGHKGKQIIAAQRYTPCTGGYVHAVYRAKSRLPRRVSGSPRVIQRTLDLRTYIPCAPAAGRITRGLPGGQPLGLLRFFLFLFSRASPSAASVRVCRSAGLEDSLSASRGGMNGSLPPRVALLPWMLFAASRTCT